MSAPARPPLQSSPIAPRPPAGRRRRIPWPRAAALTVIAAASFGVGALVGAGGENARRTAAEDFVRAWGRGDYAAMRDLLTPEARRDISLRRFARIYRDAAKVMTLSAVAGRPAAEPDENGTVVVPVVLRTRIFGPLPGRLALPTVEQEDGAAIDWAPHLVHPDLRPGEKLTRRSRMPPRAAIQARDGTPIAQGETRTSELGAIAAEVAGTIGPAPPERSAELARRGVPPDTPVGLSGLEREFDAELRGRPGGVLRADGRVLASSAPEPGKAVRTTIDPEIQSAAVEALAGRFGGVAVLRPGDGEVLALAGIAYSAPQPPGSVFKIVTLAGALDAGVARKRSRYPVETAATLEGVRLENANGESCGGTLRQSFAHSCNSVFAPLGAKLGARRLVAAAEAFGFNETPGLAGALPSTIPPAAEIGDDLAVGSSAIGQGRLLATPLEFASIAATIGEDGVRAQPTLRKGEPPVRARATTAPVARTIGSFMRSVVTQGTGKGAAIPGVQVAGKTGTAELRTTTAPPPAPVDEQDPDAPPPPPVDDTTDTTAWFAAYAPARKPRFAVAVMLVGQGAGGATAAPAARTVLATALAR
jgi:penicillin-binding protein A